MRSAFLQQVFSVHAVPLSEGQPRALLQARGVDRRIGRLLDGSSAWSAGGACFAALRGDGQQLELSSLRQDLVDEWVTAGSMIRCRVRPFLAWLERAGVTGRLDVAWDDRSPARRALADDERLAILRRLLHDPEIDLLLALAGGLPAPILAERIGIHQAGAGQWVRVAGATYVENVATRNAS
jgi:hypothetical protein